MERNKDLCIYNKPCKQKPIASILKNQNEKLGNDNKLRILRKRGLEPLRKAPLPPQDSAYTNSATSAKEKKDQLTPITLFTTRKNLFIPIFLIYFKENSSSSLKQTSFLKYRFISEPERKILQACIPYCKETLECETLSISMI